MLKGKSFSVLAGATALATIASSPALANLVFDGTFVIGGAGFGASRRALTVQSHGPSQTTESGCVGPGPTTGPQSVHHG